MAFDGILAGIESLQLSKELALSRIEKVQQPESDTLIFQVHTIKGERKKLLLCISSQGARIQFTKNPYENPALPPAFCMLLRKHIQGGRIRAFYQIETERIFQFEIETVNEMGYSVNKLLILETMGKYSNLILVNQEDKRIIDAIKHISIDENRVRQILPGINYVQAPSQGKLNFWTADLETLTLRIAEGRSVSKALQGFSPSLEHQLFEEDEVLLNPLAVSQKLLNLREEILEGKIHPKVYLNADKTPKDVHALLLPIFSAQFESLDFDSLDDAMDYFYSRRLDSNKVLQKALDLSRTITKLSDKQLLKKQRLLEEIKQAEESDKYRLLGELLNANLHLAKPGAKSVKVISYYDGKEVEIPLDERFSAAKNAQNFYKKYAKLKSSKKEKLSQLLECEAEISYLDSLLGLIPGAKTYEELELLRLELIEQGLLRDRKLVRRNKKSGPKPRKFKTSQGFTLLVGRNNVENDYITLKLGKNTDWWFHTKDIPGSHVVLVCEGKDPDAATMYEAARVAAWYSKGQQSENVPVDYAMLKFVKKPAGSKPGKVIFTNNGTIWINPEEPKEN